MLRSFSIAVLAIVASLAAPATPSLAQDVVIGFGGIFSGPYSTYSEDGRKGIEVALAQINAEGGVLGRKLRVEYYDTGADRAKAVAIYRKWGAQPEVVGFLTISTIEFIALDPIADEVKLPLFPFGSTTPFPKFSSWTFRNNTVLTKTIPYVLEEIKKLKSVKTISILQDTANPAMVAEATAVKDIAPKTGLEVKSFETFATNDQDFSTQLTNVKAADPDLINVAGSTYEDSLIISQARALKLRGIILGGNGMNDPRVANLPNNASNGIMTYFRFDPADERPFIKRFVDDYRKRYNETPASYASLAADAVYLIADAVKRAGKTDRDAVREALGKTKDLDVLNGKISFDGPGDNLVQTTGLFENRDGKYVRIK